jgi:glycosyltransferase involved in cell wall biosynthesis
MPDPGSAASDPIRTPSQDSETRQRVRLLVISARDERHPKSVGGDQHISLIARQFATAGHSVTHWVATFPGAPRSDLYRGVRVERLAPSRLLAPVVWGRLLRGQAGAFDVVLEEVIGGERTPFLAPLLSGRPVVGMWYQDNRPLFASTYGPLAARAAALVQAALLRLYRGRWLVVPSAQTREWFLSAGVPADRVTIHARPLEGVATPATPRPFAERRNLFVSIGAFRPLKRFGEAIEVLEALSESVPDAELTLVGRSDQVGYLAELRDKAARSPVGPRVHFVVDATDSTKFAVLSSAKALTIHSAIEGFGFTPLEAGTQGVPTVTNPGTPDDTVQDGLNGRKVTFGDVRAYATVLADWMCSEPKWSQFSRGSRAMAERHTTLALPAEVERLVLSAAASS